MRKKEIANAVQLSLFDDMREITDNQLVSMLTNKEVVDDSFVGEYRMERLFNSLTPHRRRLAMAAVELYRRREVCKDRRPMIRCSEDAFKLMKPIIGDLPNEEFWIIAMNQGLKVIEKVRASVGGITQTVVDIRLIMRKLVELNATCYIAVHNHPSGMIRPSSEDDRLTEKLKNASKLFDIKLFDHVIIGYDSFYSYSDEGRI